MENKDVYRAISRDIREEVGGAVMWRYTKRGASFFIPAESPEEAEEYMGIAARKHLIDLVKLKLQGKL